MGMCVIEGSSENFTINFFSSFRTSQPHGFLKYICRSASGFHGKMQVWLTGSRMQVIWGLHVYAISTCPNGLAKWLILPESTRSEDCNIHTSFVPHLLWYHVSCIVPGIRGEKFMFWET